ncbi:uncharacterized protein LOC129942717 [Eupeodes corollae]|uniref:uncharacterized protein LOC129942717 n=1 Tax=Eupeodes corollae TaxID=290404 RepID=UPI002490F473|nr:uncharacterized protein LOC129942717 [Eupeodes corollae]
MTSVKLFVLVVYVLGYANVPSCLGLELTPPEEKSYVNRNFEEFISRILLSEYKDLPTKELYRLNIQASDGSYRELVGKLINPGTAKEELIWFVVHEYTKEGLIYTASSIIDKNGLQPKELQILAGISHKLLQNLSG